MRKLYEYLLEHFIIEGGAAGHMAHPMDYNELTTQDIIDLIENLFSGNIENITEKIDGTNIQATMNAQGEVVFVRNKGDLNSPNGGMSITDMATKWADKPTVANTFISAGKIIKDVFNNIGVDFFNPDPDTKILVNCECVTAGVTNIMPYPSDQVDFHDLWIYKFNGSEWIKSEVTKNGLKTIENACKNIDKAQITPNIIIKMSNDNNKLAKQYISEFKKLMSNSKTIEEFKYNRFIEYIDKEYSWINQNHEGLRILFDRWFNSNKKFNLKDIKKMYSDYINEITLLDKKDYKNIITYCCEPLDTFFSKMGNDIINMCEGIINDSSKNDVILQLKQELNSVINNVRSSDNSDLNDKLEKQLMCLERLGNQINPVEGIVFNYKGKTMKLTGSFAALNQILGSIKYSK